MKKVGNTWLPDGDTFFPPHFARGDVFEQGNLDTALKFVRTFGVAVDAGAHVGSWSRYMAEKFGEVYAFEPHPDNYECLEANTAHQGNVVAVMAALGKTEGRATLTPGNNGGCWHLTPGADVLVLPLDYFELEGLDFLKADVEGFELDVLMGAQRLIEKYRPVVLIEEKNLPHKPLDYSARRWLETRDYREVARSGRDVVFA